ncbi:MAG: electron transfer flavoprotein subunit alpha [Chloroflexi bacterium HGW-Chloroflexi-10]|nr:MAG: electron transfer flavoprotein subunit alpha [Chloroflexi bacterium HGW-Chloroflexi-10]
MEDKDIWALAEFRCGKMHETSLELLAWGSSLAQKRNVRLCAVALGKKIETGDLEQLIAHGADCVYVVESPKLEFFLTDTYAKALQVLIEQFKPEIIIAAATTSGRSVMPYVSMRVNAGLTADCTDLDIDPETGDLLQTRPAIGGNIMATIRTPDARPQMATVRPKSIAMPPSDPTRRGEIIRVCVPAETLTSTSEFLQFVAEDTDSRPIEDAAVIVCGGKGIQKEQNFALLKQLADVFDGVVGGTRIPVDYGWLPYAHQIGLSGKTVSPRLYIACGVSGAIQHLAGIQSAETIVAINKDENAQIFQLADFAVVGDLFEIVPELIDRLKQL